MFSLTASPLFLVCGLAAMATAGMTVTARKASTSAVWFLATLLCTAALYAVHGAPILAVATILIAGGGTGTLLLLVAQRAEAVCSHSHSPLVHEPLLVCICGCLLAAGLLGTFHRSLTASSDRDGVRTRAAVERWQARVDTPTGHRPIESGQSRLVQAGRSLFVDHPLAVVILAVLCFVVLVAATLMTRDFAEGEGRIPVASQRNAAADKQQPTADSQNAVDFFAEETPK